MKILRPLPKTKTASKIIAVIIDRYPKLARAILTGKTRATKEARILVEGWVVPYNILNRLLTDDGPQFSEKFFNAVCEGLGTTLLTTTA